MTITLTFANVLLTVAVAALLFAVFYLVSTLRKLSVLITAMMPVVSELKELSKRANGLMARADTVLQESEVTVREAKLAAARMRGVIDSTATLVEDAVSIFKPVSIISQAFRNGYAIIERFFPRSNDGAEIEEE